MRPAPFPRDGEFPALQRNAQAAASERPKLTLDGLGSAMSFPRFRIWVAVGLAGGLDAKGSGHVTRMCILARDSWPIGSNMTGSDFRCP